MRSITNGWLRLTAAALAVGGLLSHPVAHAAKPAPPASANVNAPLERIYIHVAEPRDTFLKLANRYLADRKNWAVLQKYNPGVSETAIPVGYKVLIPVAAMRAELNLPTILSTRGEANLNGTRAVVGQTINERDQLSTGADGFVTIRLADGSTLTVQSKSAVALERARRLANTEVNESVVNLQSGRLETTVTKQSPAGRYEVKTPTSNMGVRGTVFRAGVDVTGKRALSEVLEGAIGLAGTSETPTRGLALNAGFGSVVEAGQPPSAPVQLLPAPALTLAPFAEALLSPNASLRFAAVNGASAYRAQVALDAAFLMVVQETVAPTPPIALTNLPDGALFVRVRALDAQGLEGLNATMPILVTARPLPPMLGVPGVGATLHSGLVEFAWQALEGGAAYRLQVATDCGFGMPAIDTAVTAFRFTVTAANVLAPGDYCWRVATVDASQRRGPFSTAGRFSIQPAVLKITPRFDQKGVQLAWKSIPGATYEYEIAKQEGFREVVRRGVIRESELALTKLPKNTYFVRVRLVGAGSTADNVIQPGPWSDAEIADVFTDLF